MVLDVPTLLSLLVFAAFLSASHLFSSVFRHSVSKATSLGCSSANSLLQYFPAPAFIIFSKLPNSLQRKIQASYDTWIFIYHYVLTSWMKFFINISYISRLHFYIHLSRRDIRMSHHFLNRLYIRSIF